MKKNYKNNLIKLYAKYPEAKSVKQRYVVMRTILQREYPSLNSYKDESLEEILRDVVYIDRQIRKMTEGIETEEKTILSQSFQLEVLPKL